MRFLRIAALLPAILWSCTLGQNQTAAPSGQASGTDAGAPTFVVPAQQLPKTLHIIAFGDVRFTDPKNTGASNPPARDALVKKIADEKPDALLISGDLPYNGSRDSDWAVYDAETKPWRDAGLRIYPALGNHELVGNDNRGLSNWWKRFPALQGRRWYSVQFKNCYFIALDSDVGLLEGTPQRQWLEAQLSHIPKETDFVFLVLHHPSYTGSHDFPPGGGHSARMQEQRLGGLLEQLQPKMAAHLIEIAGHVHNYERYEHNGVTYIVSGGGGATPYMFKRLPDDKYQGTGPTYHYVDIKIDGGKLQAKMYKLESGNYAERDSFELKTSVLKKVVGR